MPEKRKNLSEFERFRAIRRYEVRVAEEALPEAERALQAHRHAEDILAKLCEELEFFPPDAKHFSEPEISFNGVQVSHAVVVSENMVVRLVAHYRLTGVCMVVHLEVEKSRR